MTAEPYDDDDSAIDGPEDDREDDERAPNPLDGMLIGPPFALASDCELLLRDDKAKVPGCCACIQCDACGQKFRIDLLSKSGMHACPKCKLEYTSVLIVATADDHTMLRYALEKVAAANGIEVDDDGDDDQDDDEPHGSNPPRANPDE